MREGVYRAASEAQIAGVGLFALFIYKQIRRKILCQLGILYSGKLNSGRSDPA